MVENVLMNDVTKKLIETLEEVGIVIDLSSCSEDFDLREYIEDSLVFISTIVHIEESFDIEIPDELLSYDALVSFHAFVNTITELVEQKSRE